MKCKMKDRSILSMHACNSVEFNFNINRRTFCAMRGKSLLIFMNIISRSDKSRVYYRPQLLAFDAKRKKKRQRPYCSCYNLFHEDLRLKNRKKRVQLCRSLPYWLAATSGKLILLVPR